MDKLFWQLICIFISIALFINVDMIPRNNCIVRISMFCSANIKTKKYIGLLISSLISAFF